MEDCEVCECDASLIEEGSPRGVGEEGKECDIKTEKTSGGFIPLSWKKCSQTIFGSAFLSFSLPRLFTVKRWAFKRTAITAYLQAYQILIALARFCFWQLRG